MKLIHIIFESIFTPQNWRENGKGRGALLPTFFTRKNTSRLAYCGRSNVGLYGLFVLILSVVFS